MNEITTIGLDLAKHVFQVHGVDASGATVVRKRLRRSEVLAFFARLPGCLIGLEACATAHYWARELQAVGHEVRLIATAIASTVVEASGFRSGREFAAWLGLVPRQHSTGGKARLGGISKRGNRYLRRLLINGASANLLRSKATNADPWVIGLRRRRPSLVVAVALANKTARIAWAVMHRQENYRRMAAAA
jgi:transposase